MGEYNAKNYTEQGGDVTHIGGKLVIDAGADLSALLAAIADAGKMAVCDLTQKFGTKNYSDMVGEDTKILAGGVVSGPIKYVSGYSDKFPDEPDGYFFPAHLSDDYKDKTITVKRESGEGGTAKTAQEQDWVLRLTDGADTVYSFKEGDTPILTLSFREAAFLPKPED